MKRSLILGLAGTALVAGAAASGGAVAHAATTATANGQSLAAAIAQKFNLKESDVQSVIDTNRTQHEAEREAKMTERLNTKLDELVKAGTITAAQKTAIQAKAKELQAKRDQMRDTMKDKTPEERKAAIEQEKADLQNWAKQQGLSDDVLKQVFMAVGPGMGAHGKGGFGGPGGHGTMGERDGALASPSTAPTPSS